MAKRIQMEFKLLNEKSPGSATAEFIDNNINKWKVTLPGPAGTAYEGYKPFLEVELPAKYPFEKPSIKFSPSIYHPNVDDEKLIGNFCWGEDYKTQMHIFEIIQTAADILKNPNNASPINIKAAQEYTENYAQFVKTCKAKLASTHGKH
ncbi:Ubiquitin-conjugating enzyme family protein [Trichomonas vaginalis G3]|uniref:Ubiquitin-conjugating enzyme family protein n=1 Tax=Trichomonas vaginalis (strain ATCC PRA-98 / G3) TaxID=412133 RepID=A2EXE5_TRIV3|nr:anaphase-promoting complex-dependent catabolic process [Trichomonas vaginalis G3]EAY02694.1 Ubiquitin-conjugating enzyme family protein [Trichomonas vaginalis G3]KAI5507603.1 anaphase-promoting complex-dependent catabolic process [Trichomonas vaginalis G3]|eukprot:XP_001314917.1 Ubiquitin-conjugating enzyme family protein [Trichomonas vaginalis G3]